MSNENIVKKVCKELGITQKELAERLGVPQPTFARWASGDIPEHAKKLVMLYLENMQLKQKLKKVTNALKVLKEFQENE